MRPKLALVAFGGNAMLPEDQRGLQTEQMRNAQKAAELMAHIVRKGYELIIVHGNGPQVGNLLIQMEEAANKIPPYSLDVCDAMTEGSMGFMLERAIINELRRHSIDKEGASLLPQGVGRRLVEAGRVVIAAGGGGIPVIINGNGLFEGVEAVIDKDYAASLLAQEVKVGLFVILAAIGRGCINFGK